MADHVPRTCGSCAAPLTARGRCTRCARLRNPLVEAREALLPWTLGLLARW